MREILITEECRAFIEKQPERVINKFYELIEVITDIKVVPSSIVKNLLNSEFYELRIKAGNEYRVIIFTIDKPNFIESMNVVCLNGFMKKSNKDYQKAIRQARKLIIDYEIKRDEKE